MPGGADTGLGIIHGKVLPVSHLANPFHLPSCVAILHDDIYPSNQKILRTPANNTLIALDITDPDIIFSIEVGRDILAYNMSSQTRQTLHGLRPRARVGKGWY